MIKTWIGHLGWMKFIHSKCLRILLRKLEILIFEIRYSFYDNIRPPSTCIGCDYNLFKEGIQPMWEVPQNKDGGRLVLSVDKSRPDILDTLWAELLFALVGNVFGDDTPSICGAVCNIRAKGSKVTFCFTQFSYLKEFSDKFVDNFCKWWWSQSKNWSDNEGLV